MLIKKLTELPSVICQIRRSSRYLQQFPNPNPGSLLAIMYEMPRMLNFMGILNFELEMFHYSRPKLKVLIYY